MRKILLGTVKGNIHDEIINISFQLLYLYLSRNNIGTVFIDMELWEYILFHSQTTDREEFGGMEWTQQPCLHALPWVQLTIPVLISNIRGMNLMFEAFSPTT